MSEQTWTREMWNGTMTMDLVSQESFSFGAVDYKGREIGCVATIRKYTGTRKEGAVKTDRDYGMGVSDDQLGTRYWAQVQKSVGGVMFGVSQAGKSFLDEAEARAYVEKRVSDSRKKAIKQAVAAKGGA